MPTATLPDLELLSVGDKLKLIEMLWESIRADPDTLPLPDSHREELERRIEAYHRDPGAGISWEECKAKLLRR